MGQWGQVAVVLCSSVVSLRWGWMRPGAALVSRSQQRERLLADILQQTGAELHLGAAQGRDSSLGQITRSAPVPQKIRETKSLFL